MFAPGTLPSYPILFFCSFRSVFIEALGNDAIFFQKPGQLEIVRRNPCELLFGYVSAIGEEMSCRTFTVMLNIETIVLM